MDYFKGDFVCVNLDLESTYGSEQRGIRLGVIVQNDLGNEHSPTVLVAMLTSQEKAILPTNVILYPSPTNGLSMISTVMCGQIRTIDKARIRDKAGTASEQELLAIDKALTISFGISPRVLINVAQEELPAKIQVRESPSIALDIEKHIESNKKITLMDYQIEMIEAFLKTPEVFTATRLGRTLILEGIASYFLSLDSKNKHSYKTKFNLDLLFKAMRSIATKPLIERHKQIEAKESKAKNTDLEDD